MRTLVATSNILIRNKLLIYFALLFFLVFFTLKPAFSQESDEEMAKKFNISFPIAQLGNCSNIEDCKAFCNDEANQETCISFAKSKGFYQETNQGEDNASSRALLEKAKSELGCSSEDTCKAYCSEEANRDKCQAFAKKYNIDTHSQNPGNKEILEKAKSILGCDSEQSCRTVCQQEANRDKCSQFAKSTGLRGGMEKVGPGGCNSEEECKTYCSSPDNFEKCQKFGGGINKDFKGPGGCNSKESCEQFCKENEDKCQGFKEQFENKGELEKKCQENPEECLKETEQQVIKEFKSDKEFCEQNPEKCRQFAPNSEKAFEHADERAKFCRENPEKCTGVSSGNFTEQKRQFENPEGQKPPEFQRPPEQSNSGPGSFNPESSQTSGSENSGSGSFDSGSSGSGGDSGVSSGSEVQGVFTSPSLLEQLWSFFFK